MRRSDGLSQSPGLIGLGDFPYTNDYTLEDGFNASEGWLIGGRGITYPPEPKLLYGRYPLVYPSSLDSVLRGIVYTPVDNVTLPGLNAEPVSRLWGYAAKQSSPDLWVGKPALVPFVRRGAINVQLSQPVTPDSPVYWVVMGNDAGMFRANADGGQAVLIKNAEYLTSGDLIAALWLK